MVSRFRYAHFFNQLFRGHRSRLRLIQIILMFAIVFVLREAKPLIFCSFAFTPPAQSAWRELMRRGLKTGHRRAQKPVQTSKSRRGFEHWKISRGDRCAGAYSLQDLLGGRLFSPARKLGWINYWSLTDGRPGVAKGRPRGVGRAT
ncbi:MAG TPA: hypothetical protein VG055_18595 [Planctomycetaceae bacterium]|jgi:hypothetical protein|nr:hypothetical protein [Planctomycetaceae bacterium]